jgi:hypothetical protein
MFALAILFPIITGFDQSTPQSSTPVVPAADSPSTLPAQASQMPLPEPPAVTYNWRRDRSKQPVRIALSENGQIVGKTDSTPAPASLDWDTGAGKSYLIPALEVPGFLVLLNLFDRVAYGNDVQDGKKVYDSNLSTTWEHLREQNWVYDKDPFNVNQMAHPYQGATMYGLARSSGLNFWESWGYSNVGSFLWKMAGETDPPSINDMITTGNSGSLLGEALFRMSELVLRNNGPKPDSWHEIGAAMISPPTGFNRFAFGERFKPIFPSHDPATFWRFRLGANLNGRSDEAGVLDFAMSYGLPGRPGYTYKRPLDYFDFQIAGLSTPDNPVSYVLLRGLLYGKQLDVGDDYRSIWGLYGSYDYISPNIFRVSNTALSLGTTSQYWLAPGVALQGTAMGGVGFGAAGVTPTADGQRDYHYGVTPQGTLALKTIFGTRAALETVGRIYYVSGAGSDNASGSEKIVRINANLNFRVFGRHGLGVQLVESRRDAHYGSLPGKHQSDETVSIVYTFLGSSHLGAVEWRNYGDR